MTVYTWPPVGLTSYPSWYRNDPVQRSVSPLTGKRYVSAHGRSRIIAEFSASARARHGAHYMEALRRLLDGGVHYVRLYNRIFTPVTGRPAAVRWYGTGEPMRWMDGSDPVDWYTGTPGTGTPAAQDGFPAVIVTGLPASALVCLPGEIIRIGTTVDAEQRMAVNAVTSDASGNATIRVDEAFTVGAGTCIVGDVETGIFEVTRWPSGGGPLNSDFSYEWGFREVFEDEDTSGTASEVTPWFAASAAVPSTSYVESGYVTAGYVQ